MGIFDKLFGKDVETLISGLNDENENIRGDAVIAMENKGDKRLLKPLYKASLNEAPHPEGWGILYRFKI